MVWGLMVLIIFCFLSPDDLLRIKLFFILIHFQVSGKVVTNPDNYGLYNFSILWIGGMEWGTGVRERVRSEDDGAVGAKVRWFPM